MVEKGKTLLVDGPASVTLLSGEAEILGADFKASSKLVVREAKRVPFYVKEKAEFDLLLGEKAVATEFETTTIPQSWENAVGTILNQKTEPLTVMILGGVDSGKTSFCVYLANKAVKEKRKVAVIDADLGQADVGPPSTISSCRITKPIRDSSDLSAENICFVGVTSPSSAAAEVVDAIEKMKQRVLKRPVNLLVINTDGWVEGEDAIRYKLSLAKQVKPDVIVGIQEQNELTFLLGAVVETPKLTIESSPAVRKRDREERKLLREIGYKKYLKSAVVESFPISWIKITGLPLGNGAPPSRGTMARIIEQIGTTPIYAEESTNNVFIALSKEQWADEEIARNIGDTLKKKVKIVWQGDEEGLLVAMHEKNENFLGLGIIEQIDYERRVLKVYTRVKKNVAGIHVGQIKLDKSGKEIGHTEAFSDTSRNQ